MNKNLFILTIAIFSILNCAAQSDKKKNDYLTRNSGLWKNHDFENFERVFTPEILNNQLILIGEGHGTQASYEIEFDLLRKLKMHTNFRYLLLELGYLDGLLLNEYLLTGEEDKLNEFFTAHKGSFYYNKSVRAFYYNLYQFNMSLPVKQRIILLPIDLEFGYRQALKYLQEKVFVGEAASTLAAMELAKLDALKGDGKTLMESFNPIYSTFIKNSSLYKQFLDSQFDDAAYLMHNIHERFDIAIKNNFNTRRDSVMVENFNVYKHRYQLNDEKLVGLFGSFHIKQYDQPNAIRMAALLKKEAALKGIASVMLCYEGGTVMAPKYTATVQIDTAKVLYKTLINQMDYCLDSMEDGDLLKAYVKPEKGVLFNLTTKPSPFIKGKSFLMINDQYANTTDLFQVLILLNYSAATEPISGGIED